MPRHLPVSTLARYAADPEGFFCPPTAAMKRAAAHGIRWHDRLGGGGRPAVMWIVSVGILLAIGAAILFGS